MRKASDDYKVVIVHDPDSTITKDEVLRNLSWWYEDILFNNDYVTEHINGKID